MKLRGHALKLRYGRAKGGGMPPLAKWSTFAGGGYQAIYEGRTYSIDPRFNLDHARRSGGWSLRVSPAIGGLHGWIDTGGTAHGASGSFPFTTPQAAVVVARAFARKIGAEPHGIMKEWGKNEAKIDAIMRAPDFWHRVERLKAKAVAEGDADLARVCRVAISERPVRPTGHDARRCAQELAYEG